MATVTLGKRPESFKKAVNFQLLDGTTGTINITFKYRTRVEFGQMVDDMVEQAKAEGAQVPAGEPITMTDLMTKTAGQNAEYILNVVSAWDLDVPLNLANAQQLADELPAAAIQIMENYRAAVTEGRLGN
jgi:hypothetical protein